MIPLYEDTKDVQLVSLLSTAYEDEEEDSLSYRPDALLPQDDPEAGVASLKKVPPPLPTPNMRYFIIVAWVTFLGEMSRGLVVPVLWPYLQAVDGTLAFLGLVSSGFSFARFFAAPFFGWWSNKRSHKEVMLICLVLLAVGNLLYALYLPPWAFLISRIVVGLGAGTLGQSRGYVSQVTTKEQRTRFMAYLTVSQFAGFAVTPGFSILLTYIDFDIGSLEVDVYSSSGYILACLSVISIIVVWAGFADPPLAPQPPAQKAEKVSFTTRAKQFIESIPSFLQDPDVRKVLVFSALIFATRTAVAVVETASSEISQSAFGWTSQTLSYYLCGLGILGTCILIALPSICKQLGTMGEGILLCMGVFSLAFGMALMMPFQHSEHDKYSFVVGLGFTWSIGSALCQTLIISFLSRILNPNSQGAVMGFLASLGSVSRIFGAVWTGFALGSGGPFLALGVPAGIMTTCLIGVVVIVLQTYRSSLAQKL